MKTSIQYYVVGLFLSLMFLSCSDSSTNHTDRIQASRVWNTQERIDSTLFIDINGISNNGHDILAVDGAAFKVLRLNSSGELLSKVGRRGGAAGEFSKTPLWIDRQDNIFVVSEMPSGRRVHIWSDDMSHIHTFSTKGLPMSVAITADTTVFSYERQLRGKYVIRKYTSTGNILDTYNINENINGILGVALLDTYADSYIYATFPFRNDILVLSKNLRYENKIEINDLPENAELEEMKMSERLENSSITPSPNPEGTVIESFSVYKGDIYALSGYYSEPKYRNVYRIDKEGRIKEVILLPDRSKGIEVVGNNIYSNVQDTAIARYRIKNKSANTTRLSDGVTIFVNSNDIYCGICVNGLIDLATFIDDNRGSDKTHVYFIDRGKSEGVRSRDELHARIRSLKLPFGHDIVDSVRMDINEAEGIHVVVKNGLEYDIFNPPFDEGLEYDIFNPPFDEAEWESMRGYLRNLNTLDEEPEMTDE